LGWAPFLGIRILGPGNPEARKCPSHKALVDATGKAFSKVVKEKYRPRNLVLVSMLVSTG